MTKIAKEVAIKELVDFLPYLKVGEILALSTFAMSLHAHVVHPAFFSEISSALNYPEGSEES